MSEAQEPSSSRLKFKSENHPGVILPWYIVTHSYFEDLAITNGTQIHKKPMKGAPREYHNQYSRPISATEINQSVARLSHDKLHMHILHSVFESQWLSFSLYSIILI